MTASPAMSISPLIRTCGTPTKSAPCRPRAAGTTGSRRGVDALQDGLRGHYPGITDDAIVDVVRFHLDRETSV